jgi:hypothetical protein
MTKSLYGKKNQKILFWFKDHFYIRNLLLYIEEFLLK